MNQKLIDCYQKLIVNSNTLKKTLKKFKIISYKKVLTILRILILKSHQVNNLKI